MVNSFDEVSCCMSIRVCIFVLKLDECVIWKRVLRCFFRVELLVLVKGMVWLMFVSNEDISFCVVFCLFLVMVVLGFFCFLFFFWLWLIFFLLFRLFILFSEFVFNSDKKDLKYICRRLLVMVGFFVFRIVWFKVLIV